MAKREDYVKYVNMAKRLINKYGTELTVVLGLDATDEDKPFEYDETKVLSYVTTGVIMPPVRGIYFQGTRFGFHATYDKDVMDDKMSCFLRPVYDEHGAIIDFSEATHIIAKDVTGTKDVRYKVYFSDTMKPADKVILFSYGVGR
jgi:hypothetical protein